MHSSAINISALGFKFKIAGLWAVDAFRLSYHAKTCHDEEELKKQYETPTAKAPKDPSKLQHGGVYAHERFKEVAPLQLFQTLVDGADVKVRGATTEPLWQCPASTTRSFHHDAMQKDKKAEAVFQFDPPQDGCYLVEEKHPDCQSVGSPNTKVHTNYAKSLQADGTVNQTAPGNQWTFIASLQFYAGYLADVTLSNEGTEAETLATFDQLRFTRTGKDCMEYNAHPRHVEVRMTVDYKRFESHHLDHFGPALRRKLAELAHIPETSLRLTGLREGSIIADFLIIPSLVDEPLMHHHLTPKNTIELLRYAIATNQNQLCRLTAEYGVLYMAGCKVEITDKGFAQATVKAPRGRPLLQGTPEYAFEKEVPEQEAYDWSKLIIAASVTCGMMGLCAASLYMWRYLKYKKVLGRKVTKEGTDVQTFTIEPSAWGYPKELAMEEGHVVMQVSEKPDENALDDKSTNCSGIDYQGESYFGAGDIDKQSEQSGPSVCSAASKKGLRSGQQKNVAWALR
jgi:hypothetical protein